MDRNVIDGSTDWGIRLRYGVTNTSITGNRLFNNYAPYTLAGGTDTVTSDNHFQSGTLSGQATLASGSATVVTAEVRAGDQIVLSRQSISGTPGEFSIGTITSGASFTIVSMSAGDLGKINWQIVH